MCMVVGMKVEEAVSSPWSDKLKLMHMVWKMNDGANRKWAMT